MVTKIFFLDSWWPMKELLSPINRVKHGIKNVRNPLLAPIANPAARIARLRYEISSYKNAVTSFSVNFIAIFHDFILTTAPAKSGMPKSSTNSVV